MCDPSRHLKNTELNYIKENVRRIWQNENCKGYINTPIGKVTDKTLKRISKNYI